MKKGSAGGALAGDAPTKSKGDMGSKKGHGKKSGKARSLEDEPTTQEEENNENEGGNKDATKRKLLRKYSVGSQILKMGKLEAVMENSILEETGASKVDETQNSGEDNQEKKVVGDKEETKSELEVVKLDSTLSEASLEKSQFRLKYFNKPESENARNMFGSVSEDGVSEENSRSGDGSSIFVKPVRRERMSEVISPTVSGMRQFGVNKGVISRAIVKFSSPPEPHPFTVCFHFPSTFLTHRYVLEMVRATLAIRITNLVVSAIQFIDRNTIHGTQGMDNRWLVTVNSTEAKVLLVQSGLNLFNRRITVREYDDVLKEEYAEYLEYMELQNKLFAKSDGKETGEGSEMEPGSVMADTIPEGISEVDDLVDDTESAVE